MIDQILKRAKVVLSLGELKLIHKQYIMFEASVEMWLEAKRLNNLVVVAIDVCIDPIQAFKDLAHKTEKCLWECDAHTAGKYRLIVNVGLHP